jgi:adenylosuccinate synthase
MGNAFIILGALYGDEGKGSFVNYLCSTRDNPLVVRFSGGHQIGHTVVVDDTRHIFSNFGSGTLQNAPTYWSEYCTLDPVGIQREGDILRITGFEPQLFINSNAMITTPFDILKNRILDDTTKHGSVGVGFGTTIQRNEDHFRLFARDLLYPKIRNEKLRLIINSYYQHAYNPKNPFEAKYKITDELYHKFITACDDLVKKYQIVDDFSVVKGFNNIIFEGSQGIMLDKDYGFFPHVTRSNTVAKNAIELIDKYNLKGVISNINTYYITRAYQTRHGNGFLSNESMDISFIKENPLETNVLGFQGEFRKAMMDLDMLKYAINCDRFDNPDLFNNKHLVVTCLDQVPEKIPVTIGDSVANVSYEEFGEYCDISDVLPVYSDKGFGFSNENV